MASLDKTKACTSILQITEDISLFKVKSLQKKQRFFSRVAFHPLFMQVLSNFVMASTFEIL
jgi:hypothetical protein